jgi:proteasome accessory factor C
VSTANALTRFARLLTLVPFLQTHQGIAIGEAAKTMGISENDLIADLNLLWMCGLPGYSHLELIDLDFEDGHISIQNADTLAKPLSLTSDEAIALSMGLSLLGALPNSDLNEDLLSAKAKIQAGALKASELEQLNRQMLFVPEKSTDQMTAQFELIEGSILRQEQVEIDYYVPGRDQMTKRTIEPTRIRLIDGVSYVEAWCLRAEDRRQFRLDRIYSVTSLSTPRSHQASNTFSLDEKPGLTAYQVSLKPTGRWVLERYGAIDVGGNSATLFAGDPDWLLRLALSAGGDLVVTSDPELAERIRATALLALANYEGGKLTS